MEAVASSSKFLELVPATALNAVRRSYNKRKCSPDRGVDVCAHRLATPCTHEEPNVLLVDFGGRDGDVAQHGSSAKHDSVPAQNLCHGHQRT